MLIVKVIIGQLCEYLVSRIVVGMLLMICDMLMLVQYRCIGLFNVNVFSVCCMMLSCVISCRLMNISMNISRRFQFIWVSIQCVLIRYSLINFVVVISGWFRLVSMRKGMYKISVGISRCLCNFMLVVLVCRWILCEVNVSYVISRSKVIRSMIIGVICQINVLNDSLD